MLELQNHVTCPITIEHRCPPLGPRPGNRQAVVTVHGMARIGSGQGCAAKIADQTRDKRCFAPAVTTEAEIGGHHGITGHALRRIDHPKNGALQSHDHRPIFRAMQTPPILTDRRALLRNRSRATEMFLHEDVRSEVHERLSEVNRTFTSPVVVTGFPRVWQDFAPVIPDDESLALSTGMQDLIIHVLALHHANDPVGQLVQCRHALRPDGLFLGMMFGGQTLHELRTCLAEAEAEVSGGLSPRVLPMGEIRDLGALLQRAGFALPVADSYTKTVRYRDAFHLMRDLRQMGEGNALEARLRRPTARSVLFRAAEIYQAQYADADGRIPATFEIICLTGWAPSDTQQKPLRPGSAAQRLADALNTAEMPLTLPPRSS